MKEREKLLMWRSTSRIYAINSLYLQIAHDPATNILHAILGNNKHKGQLRREKISEKKE